ncbi:hypothetical protein [Streptococcus intermedius]|uniref:hypothetical protein n=1 Tax=Streptococcus intermedius TaxID=1338 RepID=UPI0020019334|nr:hypothetical protein [Streptococcus intermedius]
MSSFSVVYNSRYFAIVEDELANSINRMSYLNRVSPLVEQDVWDDVIEKYQNQGKRYVVIDEDDDELIFEYFSC